MIIGTFDTRKAESQLDLLFNIEAIFKRRALKITALEKVEKLLFDYDPRNWQNNVKFYEAFKSTSFRRVVSQVANSENTLSSEEIQSDNTSLTLEQVKGYLDKANELGLIESDGENFKRKNSMGFGSTLEWYVAAICCDELASIAYWGVEVEGLQGDYDVVLVRENQVGYIECKSGNCSNITKEEILNFLERERKLSPRFSIFLVDGVSREMLPSLVEHALSYTKNYEFEIPGSMTFEPGIETEDYKNFIRLNPINSFFVSVEDSIDKSLREVYRFLTVVRDRTLSLENKAAKDTFR